MVIREQDLSAELPRWHVSRSSSGALRAFSPGYDLDGIVVEGCSPEELVERVRDLVRVLAIAQGRAGQLAPSGPILGVEVLWPDSAAPPDRRPLTEASSPVDPEQPAPLAAHQQAPVPGNYALFARRKEAIEAGYEGDPCGACGQMTLARNGSCLKCTLCGSTTGCS